MPRRGDTVQRYPWRRAHPALAVTALMAVVLATAFAAYIFWPRKVYVTDGSHPFNENLRPVEQLIQRENEWVQKSGQPYVSLAYLQIMSPVGGGVDNLNADTVRHDIEGAYLEQLAANHPPGKPQPPLIRLLLADVGSKERSWSAAADEIKRRVSGADHLVAAVGLGLSVDNTGKLVRELASRQIAMVGEEITGDEFSGISGMVRVSPSNSDEAAAAVKYLSRLTKTGPAHQVLLVQDQNNTDDYAASLGKAFTAALARDKRYTAVSPMVYDSSLPLAGTILGGSAQRVCDAKDVDVVYFAGRGEDLQGFLAGLAGRECAAAKPLTVITGDAATTVVGRQLWKVNGANLTMIFTTLAHPDMWRHDAAAVSNAAVNEFSQCDGCFRRLFPTESLADGNAIMSHDATQAAVLAVRRVAVLTGNPTPPTAAVAQALYQLSVPGASGYICFNAQHNPVNKAIPILAMDQNGRVSYLALSSVTGTPPVNTCTQ